MQVIGHDDVGVQRDLVSDLRGSRPLLGGDLAQVVDVHGSFYYFAKDALSAGGADRNEIAT